MATTIGGLNLKYGIDANNALATMDRVIRKQRQMGAGATASGRQIGGMTDFLSRNQRGLLELSRGFEDFTIVIGTSGLGAALRASSNNLSQFFSFVSPLAGAIAGFGIAISTIAIPMLMKLGGTAESEAKKLETLKDRLKEVGEQGISKLQFSQLKERARFGLGGDSELAKMRQELKEARASLRAQESIARSLEEQSRKTRPGRLLNIPWTDIGIGPRTFTIDQEARQRYIRRNYSKEQQLLLLSGAARLPDNVEMMFRTYRTVMTKEAMKAAKALTELQPGLSKSAMGISVLRDRITELTGALGEVRPGAPAGSIGGIVSGAVFDIGLQTVVGRARRQRAFGQLGLLGRWAAGDFGSQGPRNLAGLGLGLLGFPGLGATLAGGLQLAPSRRRQASAALGPGSVLPSDSNAILAGTAEANAALIRSRGVTSAAFTRQDSEKQTAKLVRALREVRDAVDKIIPGLGTKLIPVNF